ncbi:hypothetical protein HDU76_000847 [Blyttiomyces sp. JEL0837]|nr:hypothetical protein HDU76_000847 [Blyttiomyces sp. JEL0837]
MLSNSITSSIAVVGATIPGILTLILDSHLLKYLTPRNIAELTAVCPTLRKHQFTIWHQWLISTIRPTKNSHHSHECKPASTQSVISPEVQYMCDILDRAADRAHLIPFQIVLGGIPLHHDIRLNLNRWFDRVSAKSSKWTTRIPIVKLLLEEHSRSTRSPDALISTGLSRSELQTACAKFSQKFDFEMVKAVWPFAYPNEADEIQKLDERLIAEAVLAGSDDMLQWYISMGKSIKLSVSVVDVGLHYASLLGQVAMVEKMIAMGADLLWAQIPGYADIKSNFSKTQASMDLLTVLVNAGYRLLEVGVDILVRSLHDQLKEGFHDLVDHLMEIDRYLKPVEFVKIVFNAIGVNGADSMTDEAIVNTTTSTGHVEFLRFLKNYGVNICMVGPDAIITAAKNQHVETVNFLLEAGDIDLPPDKVQQLLTISIRHGLFSIILHLLELKYATPQDMFEILLKSVSTSAENQTNCEGEISNAAAISWMMKTKLLQDVRGTQTSHKGNRLPVDPGTVLLLQSLKSRHFLTAKHILDLGVGKIRGLRDVVLSDGSNLNGECILDATNVKQSSIVFWLLDVGIKPAPYTNQILTSAFRQSLFDVVERLIKLRFITPKDVYRVLMSDVDSYVNSGVTEIGKLRHYEIMKWILKTGLFDSSKPRVGKTGGGRDIDVERYSKLVKEIVKSTFGRGRTLTLNYDKGR